MEMQKNYSGLICLSILPSNYRQLDRRVEVLEKTPEVYEDGLLVHPAIPGLMLTCEQRLLRGLLEIVDCDDDFLWRQETLCEKRLRIKWQPIVKATISSTDSSFVNMDMSLFETEVSVLPIHYYPSDIEAHEKKVVDEKAYLRLKETEAEAKAAATLRTEVEAKEEEAEIAAYKAKENVKEKEAAAVETVVGLVALHDIRESALSTCVIVEKLKQENADSEKKSHLRNLEWRLASVLSRLQSLIDEIEAGIPFGELQFLAGENLEYEIEIMDNEIALLRTSIQVLKGRIQR